MHSTGLNERRQSILAFLQAYTRQHGYAPSYREIGQACGISSVSVVKHNVDWLAANGHLAHGEGRRRALTLTPTVETVTVSNTTTYLTGAWPVDVIDLKTSVLIVLDNDDGRGCRGRLALRSVADLAAVIDSLTQVYQALCADAPTGAIAHPNREA